MRSKSQPMSTFNEQSSLTSFNGGALEGGDSCSDLLDGDLNGKHTDRFWFLLRRVELSK